MGTKAQLVNFIIENFETADGMPVSMSKLDSFKKAELEEFIKAKDEVDNFKEWIKK